MKSDLVDLILVIRKETDRAVLVRDPDDIKPLVWLPKSQIEISRDDPQPGRVTITGPQWLFEDKELV